MPIVLQKDGYKFSYSNDHQPIHVHGCHADGEAVFEVERAVELRESHGLKLRELTKAQGLAETHRELIIKKWHEHFPQFCCLRTP